MRSSKPDDGKRRTVAELAALLALGLSGLAPTNASASLSKELETIFRRTDELTGVLRGSTIGIEDWRSGMDDLFQRVPLQELLEGLDFEPLARRTGYAPVGVRTVRVRLGDAVVKPVNFIPRFFAIGPGRAIIPHGHRGMVSAHLVLSGSLHLRQYDTIGISRDHLELRPTVDRQAGPGDLSSIGMKADNTHWFVADQASHTLDTIVTGLGMESDPAYEIFNLDMYKARQTESGTLLAPRLSVDAALRKYG